jgi:hypothetical protein
MHRTFIRVAPSDGALVIDLGDASWRGVVVTDKGWKLQESAYTNQ